MLCGMTHAAKRFMPDTQKPVLPHWMIDTSIADTPEYAGFASGSALALLHGILHDFGLDVPQQLLRKELALTAAIHCLRLARTRSGRADLLDAYYLTKPDDAMGPAGDMLAFWLKACSIKIGPRGWQDRVMTLIPEDLQHDVYGWLDFGPDGSAPKSPIAEAATLLRTVYDTYSHYEHVAFLLADIRLAHEMRWPFAIPLFGQHLTGKELRAASEEVLIECHRSVTATAKDAVGLAYDLAARAHQLKSIAPKLRAKGADDALSLFLLELAVTPSGMLSPVIKGTQTEMTARAARRLCDRLVELGVVKELTGRSTFRLYRLVP